MSSRRAAAAVGGAPTTSRGPYGRAATARSSRARAKGCAARCSPSTTVCRSTNSASARAVAACRSCAASTGRNDSGPASPDSSPILAHARRASDLIHGQHLISIPAAVAAGAVTGLPTVATVRDYWPTCPIGTRLPRCPELAHCSTACQVCCLARGQAPLRPLVRAALPYVAANLRRRQRALLAADRTIAVSSYVARGAARGIPGLEPVVMPEFHRSESAEAVEVGRRSRRRGPCTATARLTTHDSSTDRPLRRQAGRAQRGRSAAGSAGGGAGGALDRRGDRAAGGDRSRANAPDAACSSNCWASGRTTRSWH